MMDVAIIEIGSSESLLKHSFDIKYMSRQLSFRGYNAKTVLTVENDCDLQKIDEFLRQNAKAIIVLGQTDIYYEYLSSHYTILKSLDVVEVEETIYAFSSEYKPSFVVDIVIPALNSKSKTYYNTIVIKTCTKTADELREILKEYIKNKSRIVFKFIENPPECEVHIRFSSKMQKAIVDNVLVSSAKLLDEFTYSMEDVSLAYQVADYLKIHNKKICIAESFTGGNITKSLVDIAGASAFLKEGIVAYSNEAKSSRLNVSPTVLANNGAVSIEAIYEMAANQLIDNLDCDVCIATSGNAGPTAEKEGEEGLCYIAVGNKNGIHLYRHNFTGSREEIIRQGSIYALFYAYRKLKESEFNDLLTVYQTTNQQN